MKNRLTRSAISFQTTSKILAALNSKTWKISRKNRRKIGIFENRLKISKGHYAKVEIRVAIARFAASFPPPSSFSSFPTRERGHGERREGESELVGSRPNPSFVFHRTSLGPVSRCIFIASFLVFRSSVREQFVVCELSISVDAVDRIENR